MADQSGPPADPTAQPPGGTGAVRAPLTRTIRTPLDRRRVLTAAIDYIDEHGLEALTMRRLGAHLGVEGMALYRHVTGREDLLDGVVELVIDALYGDPEVYLAPQYGWQDYLQRLAHGVRRMAMAHPAVFPLVATRPPAAPWVRPPLRSLRWLESFLDALTDHGFTDEGAVAAYRAYTSFLLGHLLLEVSQRGVPISPLDDPDASPSAGARSLDEYPHIRRLAPLLAEDESAAEFEESLENLLERLARLLRESQHPGVAR
ncbi:TetR/AcrR family transcriptional regulator C-terminal domain-containing protein [Geodermatophilus sp. DSM 44513]|uniref:TetR/AcrR family transcriptional regulator C-terminal domain-containing protein n=1 Tax=Geodermatophilus sp. DSM 44513 TaxID=1528104 RepID=UPI001272F954|nr:TetR/AcrR family transcriptional regulator C-terminal domain-containing protein [Geodermatophilus sp. DSM 44513]WNV75126.1 TetR/AcrR family transcriptional regulator C-terminal domain-containing protein [Geodermatophilus sp. DSM 44513]